MVEGCRRKRSSLLKNSIVELIDEEKRQILLSLHGDSQHFQSVFWKEAAVILRSKKKIKIEEVSFPSCML
jgi:hypothetical protein